MKKAMKKISVLVMITLLFSSVFSIFAYADTEPTQITIEDSFTDGLTMQANTMQYYLVEVNNPDLTLSVKSSDESVIKADLQDYGDSSGNYVAAVAACGTGSATVTITASDGTSAARNITVDGTAEPNYTVTSDTTQDFSISKNSSYIMKVHFTSDDNFGIPVLQTSLTGLTKADDAVKIVLVDADGDDYYYRIDAVGNAGAQQTLYLGGFDFSDNLFIPEKLCTVSITNNKSLTLDTTCDYIMNEGETYRFTAYTTSSTAPAASVYNDRATVECLGPVTGGYQYRLTAVNSGETMVTVTSGSESASFPVSVTTDAEPSVISDSPENISVAQGSSYTYKFTIMGGGEPVFKAETDGVVSVQMVKKDGINYYCKVTATGQPQSQTALDVSFPEKGEDYDIPVGNITVTPGMKSDTNADFSLQKGSSYTFKITGATNFNAGSSGVLNIQLVAKSGRDSFYKVTAVGNPGQSAGLYMSNPGYPAQKVCAVTVKPVEMKSDTNSDFSLQKGSSYTFKITGATSFHAGSSGVLNIQLIGRSGADSFYRVTAVGNPGQSAGLYMSAAGTQAKKVCAVTIKPVVIKSDTNTNFSLAKGASYQFKITAAGVSAINFNPGSSGVFKTTLVGHSGSDFFYKLTAIGTSGQKAGIYASVTGQPAQQICVVSIK